MTYSWSLCGKPWLPRCSLRWRPGDLTSWRGNMGVLGHSCSGCQVHIWMQIVRTVFGEGGDYELAISRQLGRGWCSSSDQPPLLPWIKSLQAFGSRSIRPSHLTHPRSFYPIWYLVPEGISGEFDYTASCHFWLRLWCAHCRGKVL